MEMVGLVALLAILEYFVLGFLVGRKRGDVPAPAMTGPPDFERTLRAQQNMAERLVLFLPALYLSAQFNNNFWTWVIGLIWVVARAIYAAGYISSAQRRIPGILLAVLCEIALMGMAGYGLFVALT
ncbi:MAG: MAPEG family protein [Acidobacteriota bacterium]